MTAMRRDGESPIVEIDTYCDKKTVFFEFHNKEAASNFEIRMWGQHVKITVKEKKIIKKYNIELSRDELGLLIELGADRYSNMSRHRNCCIMSEQDKKNMSLLKTLIQKSRGKYEENN